MALPPPHTAPLPAPSRRMEAFDLKVVVEVVGQMLAHSARSGGTLAGAMVWSAAHNDSEDQDG